MYVFRKLFFVAVIDGILSLCLSQKILAQILIDHIDEHLRNRIEAGEMPPQIVIRGERICASVALPNFYEKRAYKPAWIDEKGPTPNVESLIRAVREAGTTISLALSSFSMGYSRIVIMKLLSQWDRSWTLNCY